MSNVFFAFFHDKHVSNIGSRFPLSKKETFCGFCPLQFLCIVFVFLSPNHPPVDVKERKSDSRVEASVEPSIFELNLFCCGHGLLSFGLVVRGILWVFGISYVHRRIVESIQGSCLCVAQDSEFKFSAVVTI